MKAVWLIARSYFFSRKNPSAINIITGISLGGYALGAMSLLVLLSALNGFEDSIFGGIRLTSPELVVIGDRFSEIGDQRAVIGNQKTVIGDRLSVIGDQRAGDRKLKTENRKPKAVFSQSLIDKAIVKYGDKQTVARVWGVDSNFFKVYDVDSLIVAGNAQLGASDAWMSESLIYQLNIEQVDRPVEVMTPSRTAGSLAQTTLNLEELSVRAMFRIREENKENTLVVPIEVARSLFEREDHEGRWDVNVLDDGKVNEVKGELKKKLGKGYDVLDRAEQHGTLYRMFNTEKWFSFALLAFVLLLISFNLFGSIRMMQIDKTQDLKMLSSLGMSESGLKWIFLLQAIWVSVVGTLVGIGVALALIWVQLRYGLVTTQSSFEMVYPVSLRVSDIGLVFGLNLLIGLLVGVMASTQTLRRR
jgi:lipoprotein-releasing system permease protein